MRRPSFDAIVNVVILATCVVLVGVSLQSRGMLRLSAKSPQEIYKPKVGAQAETLTGVSYAGHEKTVVLFVQDTCPYCTDSMPFYRQLREATRARTPSVRLVVASVNKQDALVSYLKANNVAADVLVAESVQARNKVTPTLLVVDGAGTIREAWVGQQPAETEREILAAVTKAS